MRIAINKKYKYITPESVYNGNGFEAWVMDEKYQTHSIVEVNDIDVDKLRFSHFDYDEETDIFSFNIDKYNADLVPSREQINQQVVQKIREKYTVDDEFQMQRLGVQDSTNAEYQGYLAFVSQCIEWGNSEKVKYGYIAQ